MTRLVDRTGDTDAGYSFERTAALGRCRRHTLWIRALWARDLVPTVHHHHRFRRGSAPVSLAHLRWRRWPDPAGVVSGTALAMAHGRANSSGRGSGNSQLRPSHPLP